MRLGQLAKQLEVKPREILDFLNKNQGLDLEMNLNLKIEQEWEDEIKKTYPPKQEEVAENETVEAVEEKTLNVETLDVPAPTSEVESQETEENSTPLEVEEVVKSAPVEITGEVPKEVIENAPLVERQKIVLEGPKILHKIELPEKPKPKAEDNVGENLDNQEKEETNKPARKKNIKNKRITLTEEERFARYQKRMEENKKREEKDKKRKQARAEKLLAEKRKEHYLNQVKNTPQAKPKHKVKKEKLKAKENVSPMMVAEIERRERERRAHNKSWFGRMMQKLFGI